MGSLLFAIGLYSIICLKLNLYTGRICTYYSKKELWFDLLLIWLGNFIGAFVCANLISLTRVGNQLQYEAINLILPKLMDNLFSIFILAIFCGIMMYLATQASGDRVVLVFICVTVFILSGFEHVVANMFYFSLADIFSIKVIEILFVATLGNTIGGIAIPVIRNCAINFKK